MSTARRPEMNDDALDISWGRVTFHCGVADIRNVRIDGREVVRRIFVTVRDSSWREVAPSSWFRQVDRVGRLRLGAEHRQGGIDFRWTASIEINPETGMLELTMEGRSFSTFLAHRVGLAILHPAAGGLVGGVIATDGADGTERVSITERLLPQHLDDGVPRGLTDPFTQLETRFADHTSTRFDFQGSAFQIEDQRNFGDDSFKTYSPPITSSDPMTFASGDSINLRVSIASQIHAETDRPSAAMSTGALPAISSTSPDVQHPLLQPPLAGRVRVDGYFVEANRGMLPLRSGALDFVASPTVHSGDVITIAENVAAVAAMSASAKAIGGAPPTITLTLSQGPPLDQSVLDFVGIPWAVACLCSLTGRVVRRVNIGSDLLSSANASRWLPVMDALEDARQADFAEYIGEYGAGLHTLRWSDRALLVNLDAHPRALPERYVAHEIWPGSAPASVVPAYGIVLARSSAAQKQRSTS